MVVIAACEQQLALVNARSQVLYRSDFLDWLACQSQHQDPGEVNDQCRGTEYFDWAWHWPCQQ